ncbi:30S ribosomal protein S6 [candidate division KSB3 bacterium]|uniref:Small ribosomal subunit protein bS6 n=1 Tax=candidate division KSB3 bacterium TaxID=2044937 RepID=A0A9D5K141_9BACT|nr:30S ribosomal protein S6 [candidate division KSB3 bacterium]MBD3327590.1 30S ribosomal protein S6 [candidate division KSB3 bacterium]
MGIQSHRHCNTLTIQSFLIAPCPETRVQGCRATRRYTRVQNNTYEALFILNPDLEDSEITSVLETLQDMITTSGGATLKIDKWGRRQLAYMIQKKREGYYVLIYFEAPPTFITEMDRRCKLIDPIMRHLVVQLKPAQRDELLKTTEAEAAAEGTPEDAEPTPPTDTEPEDELVASTEEK